MNKKGFTLIELLATIILLGIVAAIGGIGISNIISSSKQNDYKLLISDIVHASELYYQECTYMPNLTGSNYCKKTGEIYSVKLSELVNYGFLTSDSENNTIINPETNEDISSCNINISYNDGTVTVTSASTSPCPEEYK